MPYWAIFSLILKKQHKYFSVFFNYHIEYTKKQVGLLAILYWVMELFFCHVYAVYMHSNSQVYYNSYCLWGCRSEPEILAGVMCSIAPWPVFYICKYLYSDNIKEINLTQSRR
jgi:hypothetical protein